MALDLAIHRRRKFQPSFVGVGLLIFILLSRLASSQLPVLTMPNKLQDFITLSASVIVEATPFVLLGILFSIFVQTWLPENFLIKILPRKKLLRRGVLSFFGIFMPVCECGNLPLARGMMIRGLSLGDTLTFLIAAPILNPVTIITTHVAFGGDMTILASRLIGGFLIANILGWLYGSYKKTDHLITKDFSNQCRIDHKKAGKQGKLEKSLAIFKKEANIIMPALLMGGFIAGAVQVATPREALLGLGGHVILSVLAMIVLAFVVSICASVDAFFALAFSSSFTTGSLVSFLVFGPIIDIKMLNLMKTTFTKQVLVNITVVTFLVSLTLGLAVNYAF